MDKNNQGDMFPTPAVIKTPKVAPLEKRVEARLVSRVRAAGSVSWKFTSPNNRGVNDRLVLIDGRTIYVEVKRDGGKMTPLQVRHMQMVLDNGGEYALVEGMDGVDKFIKKIESERAMWKVHFRAIGSVVGWFKGYF